jgi:hypothetical protein
MANKSNWKHSEALAAKLFPGAKRRMRVGGSPYDVKADDVVWLFNEVAFHKRVVKKGRGAIPPVYIEVKKRAKFEVVSMLRDAEKKYHTDAKDRTVLVLHRKRDRRLVVALDSEFFAELLRAWMRVNDL